MSSRLQTHALANTPDTFFIAMQNMEQIVDLRRFFGGMHLFFDAHGLASHVSDSSVGFDGLRAVPNEGTKLMRVDPVLLNSHQVSVSFHMPSLLLLYSLMRVPRLDPGIMPEFSHSVVQHLMTMTPKSVMPYTSIPIQRLNPFTMEQEQLNISGNRCRQARFNEHRRPPQILRFVTDAVVKRFATIQCAGLLRSGVLEVSTH